MAEFKRTTRVKRDFSLFRDRLKKCIEDSGLTQVEAAAKCDMDARTFNHVVTGPTHPDLLLLRDIGEKLKFNLNYLFGLSERKQKIPDIWDSNLEDYIPIPLYETHDTQPLKGWDENKGRVILPTHLFTSTCATFSMTFEEMFATRVTDTDCDELASGNPIAYFKKQDFVTKKAVYSIGVAGKHYFRWAEVQLGNQAIHISNNVLMKDSQTMQPEDVSVFGMMVRKVKDC